MSIVLTTLSSVRKTFYKSKRKKLSVITSLLCKHTVRLLIRFPTASTLLSLAITVMYIYIISITI